MWHKICTAIMKLKQGVFLSHIDEKIMLLKLKNKNLLQEYKKCKTYYKLKKQYGYLLTRSEPAGIDSDISSKMPVWTCWFQGEKNAPPLVRSCLKSMRNCFGKENVKIITDENFADYVLLPEFILEKYNTNIISRTHFSDILRTELLYRYGGIWIDSTVFCSAPEIPEYISDSDFFCYSVVDMTRNDCLPIVASSWFLKAEKNNSIIAKTRELIFAYWKKEKHLCNYNLFHIFFALASEVYKEEWNKVPVFSNIQPHIMQFELFKPYSKERIMQIFRGADFHKLNWRLMKKEKDDTYTNYDWILRHTDDE